MAVSPGSAGGVETIATRCPTFSWSTVVGSNGSELSIWPVGDVGEVAGPALRVEIPGDARSWTPSDESCLEAGRTYAWRVGNGEGRSAPHVLRVAGGQWLEEFLEEVVFELLASGRAAAETFTPAVAAAGAGGAAAAPPVVALHGSGTASLHVETADFFGLWAGGESVGIFASASQTDGRGVYGLISGGSGSTPAVTGISDSQTGYGVRGFGDTYGVEGVTEKPSGIGVQGIQSGIYVMQGGGCGVDGTSFSDAGRGVTGRATAATGTNYGVYGANSNPAGWDFFAAGTGTYMPFTGAHEVRLEEDASELRPGMVVSATGRVAARRGAGGEISLSSTLPGVERSRRPFDPAVLGVFVAPLETPPDRWVGEGEGGFAVVNALGEGRVWVTDVNGPVSAGDYLTTSAIPGYAQRQGDDVHRAYTLGKAIEDLDWATVTETVEQEGRSHRAALIAVVYTSG